MQTVTTEQTTVVEAMAAADFRLAPMGGNIEAWRRDVAPNQHVLITCGEDGCDTFGDPDAEEWLACAYFHDRPEYVEGEDNGAVTLADALAWAASRAQQ